MWISKQKYQQLEERMVIVEKELQDVRQILEPCTAEELEKAFAIALQLHNGKSVLHGKA